MVELVLAGVIIGAIMTAAAVTDMRDRRRRRSDRRGPVPAAFGEPIPSGWASTAGYDANGSGGDCAGGGGDC